MAILQKALTKIVIEGVEFSVQADGFASVNVALTDGEYYVSGDDSASDLLKHIEDRIRTEGASEGLDALFFQLDSGNLAEWANPDNSPTTITWDSATDLRDLLGFPATATSVYSGANVKADHVAEGSVYPSRVVAKDSEQYEAVASSVRATDGSLYSLSSPPIRKHQIKWRFVGGPRETSHDELAAFREFWFRVVAQKHPFRYFPDKTVNAEETYITEPYGYIDLVVDSAPEWNIDFMAVVANWYREFSLDMTCYQVTT